MYNVSGYRNTAGGVYSLFNNTGGYSNTAAGTYSLYSNTTGYYNTAYGEQSLYFNTIGALNTAVGVASLTYNTTGILNTAIGVNALNANTTGSYNTAIGFAAYVNGTFNFSSAFGYAAPISASNQIRIGASNVTSIGGFRPWTNLSDGRFKKNVKENVKGLDFILKLRPVTYNLDIKKIDAFLKVPDSISNGKNGELIKYKRKAEKEIQTGFIAQEVEQAAKELGYDFSGVDKPKNENDYYGLRYAEFVVPLVKAVQEQNKVIEDLKQQNNRKDEIIRKLQQGINLQNERINKLFKLINK